MDVAGQVARLLVPHASVTRVELIGSRARGDPQPLSDWDFSVGTHDFVGLARDLPALVGSLEPLAAFWDPLASNACYMFILRGPMKIDLLFDVEHIPAPPWIVSRDTLAHMDVHFWDWSLWLASKVLAGKKELERSELAKMSWFLLNPLGIRSRPADLAGAVAAYLATRERHERELGVTIPRELGNEVLRALREHGVVPTATLAPKKR